MSTRWWVALLAATLPASAGAAVVQTIDRYLLLEGPFAGETVTLETRYDLPAPDLPQLTDRAFAEVMFLGLSGVDDDALVVSDFPPNLQGVEIYADFFFDPASNVGGSGISTWTRRAGRWSFSPGRRTIS